MTEQRRIKLLILNAQKKAGRGNEIRGVLTEMQRKEVSEYFRENREPKAAEYFEDETNIKKN